MKLWMKAPVIVSVALALSGSAWAQCSANSKAHGAKTAAGEKSGQCAAACKSKDAAACQGKALMAAGAPVMQYRVGEQTTNCPKQAAEWSGKDDAQVRYVVGETEYTDKAEALRAYAAVLESHLGTITSVRYAVGDKVMNCPIEAASMAKDANGAVKFQVASFTFDDKDGAERAATAAREAADKPTMKMIVDGKEVACEKTCDKSAKQSCHEKNADGSAKTVAGKQAGGQCCHSKGGTPVAKGTEKAAEGKTCEYVVGEMKTCCEATARAELAQARILAAYQAVEELAAAKADTKEVAASAEPVGS